MKNRVLVHGDTATVWLRREGLTSLPCLIDSADLNLLECAGLTWVAKPRGHLTYAMANVKVSGGKWTTVLMHRVVLGESSPLFIDHVDGDGLNNRRANLRRADAFDNQLNRHSTRAKSGYRGVREQRGRFTARIQSRAKTHTYLGSFSSAEAAAAAVRTHLMSLGAPACGIATTTSGRLGVSI